MSMTTMQELEEKLSSCIGTEFYHRHWIGGLYTDGIKMLAEEAKAFWLLDAIFSYRRAEPFQVWKLEVKDQKGILTMREDDGQPELVRQEFEYTDFPEGIFECYLIDKVLLLKNEY